MLTACLCRADAGEADENRHARKPFRGRHGDALPQPSRQSVCVCCCPIGCLPDAANTMICEHVISVAGKARWRIAHAGKLHVADACMQTCVAQAMLHIAAACARRLTGINWHLTEHPEAVRNPT